MKPQLSVNAQAVVAEWIQEAFSRLRWYMGTPEPCYFQHLRRYVSAMDDNDPLARALTLDEQLSLATRLAEWHGDLTLDIETSDLRDWITQTASEALRCLARRHILARLTALEAFMLEYGFEFTALYSSVELPDIPQRGRCLIPRVCWIYEYRNMPGLRDADVWLYRLTPVSNLYLIRPLDSKT